MKKVALIFAGQGSQSVGMGKDLYEHCSKASELLNNASSHCDIDFKSLLFTENERLNSSEFTQPAIMLNSMMAYLALKENFEFELEFALGHSLGEFSALAISGGLNFLDALLLVRKRGQFMQEDCAGIDASMLVVLGLEDKKVEEICAKARQSGKEIYPANYNCDGQIVVAGIKAHLSEFEAEFKEAGAKKTMLLNMSVASHCPLLKNASLKLKPLLENALSQEFSPVISNVNAKPYKSKAEALELLPTQLIKPVLYKQSIQSVAENVDVFIEVGSKILAGLNKKITDKKTYSFTNMNDLQALIKEIQA